MLPGALKEVASASRPALLLADRGQDLAEEVEVDIGHFHRAVGVVELRVQASAGPGDGPAVDRCVPSVILPREDDSVVVDVLDVEV